MVVCSDWLPLLVPGTVDPDWVSAVFWCLYNLSKTMKQRPVYLQTGTLAHDACF